MLWLSNVIPFAKTKWICLYILRADDKMLLLLLSLFLSLWCFVILVASFILDESHTHKNFLLNARSQGVHVPITAIFFFCFMLREPPKIFYQHSTDCRSVVLFSFYSYSFVMAFWVNYFVCDCVQTQYRSFVCWKKKKISQNSRLTQYIAMNSASSILSGMQCILASNYIHP